jgi:hypothetical protein
MHACRHVTCTLESQINHALQLRFVFSMWGQGRIQGKEWGPNQKKKNGGTGIKKKKKSA